MSGLLLGMPFLVINMGGEMIYILDQRLRAQKITTDKSRKVLRDVVKTMFTPKMMSELFRPQRVYSPAECKKIFEKLAHSSIMRLNETSMSKLYDLMTMGFKYQVLLCSNPQQLLQVTLNHLESIKEIVDGGEAAVLVQDAIDLCLDTYCKLSPGEWFILKHQLCLFFQSRRVKVSLFLQNDMQRIDGTIVLSNRGPVPYYSDVPGLVRHHRRSGEISEKKFSTPSSIGVTEARRTYFNLNSTLAGQALLRRLDENRDRFGGSAKNTKAEPKTSGREELSLLSSIMGLKKSESKDRKSKDDSKPFRFVLFPGDDDEKVEYDGENEIITINIDGTSEWRDINERMKDLDFLDDHNDSKDYKNSNDSSKKQEKGYDDDEYDEYDDDDDLLALMDSIK